ncbi:hypothetical protein DFR71_6615 [Nocardia alba]|uniref:Secreted protein n=1 Tax=Nocardia alba TaxID=225051 RepID=A0A4R1F5Z2_9NOCA|nr:hypothetical protein DFR71_6615 [Nocardia alba]
MRKAILAVATVFIGSGVMLITAGPAQADNSLICVKGGGRVHIQTAPYPKKGTQGVCLGGRYDGQVLFRHYTY